jgi:hypothetical protein
MTGTPSDGATMSTWKMSAHKPTGTWIKLSVLVPALAIEITYQPIGEAVLIAVKAKTNLKLPALLKKERINSRQPVYLKREDEADAYFSR